jgi:hypothetical protein
MYYHFLVVKYFYLLTLLFFSSANVHAQDTVQIKLVDRETGDVLRNAKVSSSYWVLLEDEEGTEWEDTVRQQAIFDDSKGIYLVIMPQIKNIREEGYGEVNIICPEYNPSGLYLWKHDEKFSIPRSLQFGLSKEGAATIYGEWGWPNLKPHFLKDNIESYLQIESLPRHDTIRVSVKNIKGESLENASVWMSQSENPNKKGVYGKYEEQSKFYAIPVPKEQGKYNTLEINCKKYAPSGLQAEFYYFSMLSTREGLDFILERKADLGYSFQYRGGKLKYFFREESKLLLIQFKDSVDKVEVKKILAENHLRLYKNNPDKYGKSAIYKSTKKIPRYNSEVLKRLNIDNRIHCVSPVIRLTKEEIISKTEDKIKTRRVNIYDEIDMHFIVGMGELTNNHYPFYSSKEEKVYRILEALFIVCEDDEYGCGCLGEYDCYHSLDEYLEDYGKLWRMRIPTPSIGLGIMDIRNWLKVQGLELLPSDRNE